MRTPGKAGQPLTAIGREKLVQGGGTVELGHILSSFFGHPPSEHVLILLMVVGGWS